jgi:hypothetical protein
MQTNPTRQYNVLDVYLTNTCKIMWDNTRNIRPRHASNRFRLETYL